MHLGIPSNEAAQMHGIPSFGQLGVPAVSHEFRVI